MAIFTEIEHTLVSYADKVPLELFTLVGTFVEEVIAPIPSPLMMTTAGSLAALQGKAMSYLLVLSVIGAVGKLFGAWILYFFADKAEDIVLGRFGKFLGVSHKDVESVGKHLNGGYRDDLILIVLRALPIIPSSVVSVGSGILKINLKTYLYTTFIGTIVRDFVFLYFGFIGVSAFGGYIRGFESVESLIQIGVAGAIFLFFAYMYYKRGRGK